MNEPISSEATALFRQARAGSEAARDRLFRLVYDELRQAAGRLMGRERADHTLQPTALVNEALLRLLDQDVLRQSDGRAYFFAAASRAMRQVLVDHARTRSASKRGGGRGRVPLDEALAWMEEQQLDVLDLHEGLERLAALHERQARVVEMRFFGGFKVEEVAEALGVSVSLVEGDLRKASAFLRARLAQDD
jgi:RNA polymerase sigma factor (TIGR02999 family)